ncbi:MAG: AraC family transcriptional regulator [Victivallales bacterium]|nr:AraC family transcriptional regulator [Victivallales bacterium]
MYITENIRQINSVSLYQAPDHARVQPVTIPPKSENIEIITGGEVFFDVNGSSRTFHRGAIFWHLPGEQTVWQTSRHAPYNCLSVRVATYDAPERRLPRVTFWENDDDLTVFTREALRSFHDDSIDRDVLHPYIYAKIFWQAYYYTRRKPDPDYPLFLRQLLDHINHHLAEDLSIDALAALSGVSVPCIHAQFRRHLNQTPHRYILNRRLQYARNLLAGSRLPIKELGAACGFANIESFYRAFHRCFDITPGEYRSRHRLHLD